MTVARLVWDAHCLLGEGPVWSVADQALWFVDIKGGAVLRYRPGDGGRDRWNVGGEPGFALPAADGGLIIGLADGLHRFDPATGTTSPHLAVEEDRPGNRLNDGFVATDGSLWFGSMDNGERAPTGQLLRYDGCGATVHDGGYVITNGPALAPGGRTFYHTDTVRRTVYAFDHEGARLTNKRVFLRFDATMGHPDGTTVDADGGLWIGFFGGSCVRRFDAGGTQTDEVALPVSNVTKLALGGPDLTTAYVTTACWLLDDAALTAQPLAGALFAFEVAIPGLPGTACAG